jgi:putative serine protease PepD
MTDQLPPLPGSEPQSEPPATTPSAVPPAPDTTVPPAPEPYSTSAAAWPAGWGTPPPVWQPPAPRSADQSRRPVMLAGAAMLAVGLAAGAAVTAVFARGGNSNNGTAAVLVDTSPLKSNAGDAVQVAKTLGPAVGTIIAGHGSRSQDALGSGFVIAHDSSKSYVLTNNHVVSGAIELHAVFPGGHNLTATVVGTDTLDDLAVVSVNDSSLPAAVFASSSQLQVGQAVVAIGSPLGNEGSVTQGVISALHRTISAGSQGSSQSEVLQDVLQTDASINPGNSGGPLADTSGRVIGVNVAIAGSANNIGFSIPSDIAQSVAQELINHQKVGHPFLGINYETAIDATELGHGFDGIGVLVTTVSSGSPADKAGFKVDDILQAVDGVTIDNGQTLGGLIQKHHVGDTVKFTVKRGGSTQELSATLVDRPTNL